MKLQILAWFATLTVASFLVLAPSFAHASKTEVDTKIYQTKTAKPKGSRSENGNQRSLVKRVRPSDVHAVPSSNQRKRRSKKRHGTRLIMDNPQHLRQFLKGERKVLHGYDAEGE